MAVMASGVVRERLERRFWELTHVVEDAGAERKLSVYLAWRRGLGLAEIARVTRLGEGEIRGIVAAHERDEDAADYQEGPRWVEMWPHDGWSVSR